MDGRKAFPIHHGATTPTTLLHDAGTYLRRHVHERFGVRRIRTLVAHLAGNSYIFGYTTHAYSLLSIYDYCFAVKVIKANFMEVETKNPRFSMMGLAKIA